MIHLPLWRRLAIAISLTALIHPIALPDAETADPCTAENPNAEQWGPFCYSHAPTLHHWSGQVVPHCTEAGPRTPCFDYADFNGTTWKLGIARLVSDSCNTSHPFNGSRVQFCTESTAEGVLCHMREINATGVTTRHLVAPCLEWAFRAARRAARGAPSPARKGAPSPAAGPTPPRRRRAGRPREAPSRILITSFRAEGSIGSLASVIYGGVREGPRYETRQRRYLELQSDAPRGFPNSPGVWTSLESFALGQVNFPGVVKRDRLFNMLNRALNLYDARGRLHDFRRVYPNWKWKYQVVEVLTVPRNRMREFKDAMGGKMRRVVARDSGSSGRR